MYKPEPYARIPVPPRAAFPSVMVSLHTSNPDSPLDDELVANKLLLVVNGGVLKIISAMVEKAIR